MHIVDHKGAGVGVDLLLICITPSPTPYVFRLARLRTRDPGYK